MLISFFKLAALSLCVTEISEKEESNDNILLLYIIVNDICSNLETHDFQENKVSTHEMT